ncbi:MAG: hypothetical protein JO036_21460 [Candidatus Eremiobacteraeota bacterium]|nr:hypothetical protein [Candidatus Eremiobacteraeota bacterium]
MTSLAACSGGSSRIVPSSRGSGGGIPANYTRRLKYTARTTFSDVRKLSYIQQPCTSDTCGGGGGTIYTDPTAEHVMSVSADGSTTCTGDYNPTATSQLSVAGQDGSFSFSTTGAMQTAVALVGQPQTTVYSDGSRLTRTVVDDNNANGTFVDPSGVAWSVSAYCDSTHMTYNYSGPSSGTITVTLSGISTSSSSRAVQGCTETQRKGTHVLGTAFDAASVFLGCIGLAPAAVVTGVIGVGLGLYSAYC